MVIDSERIDPIVEWMRVRGVRRLRMPDGLEVELDPFEEERRRNHATVAAFSAAMDGKPPAEVVDRPAPIAQAFADVDGAGICACGHSWLDHNDLGCLHGCSHAACMSQESSEPEQAS